MFIREWRSEVYKPRQEFELPENWQMIREAVLKRDGFVCQRCDKKFGKSQLSVHHIMPRDEGGCDDMTNLITLCHPCHDYVEIKKLRTKAAIIGSLEEPKPIVYGRPTGSKNQPSEPIEPDEYGRKEWHARVYGGKR